MRWPGREAPAPPHLSAAPLLTNRGTQRTVEPMFLAPRTGRPFFGMLLALAASLSLLIAPLCAAFCSADVCTRAGAPSCHDAGPAPAPGPIFASIKNCARADLFATLLKSDESSFSLSRTENAAAYAVAGAGPSLVIRAVSLRLADRAPFAGAQFSPACSVLRR